MTDSEIITKAEKAINLAAANDNGGVGFDPLIIVAIIQIVIDAIRLCRRLSSVDLKNPSMLTRLIIDRAVRRELRERYGIGAYYSHGGARIVSAILAAGKDASPEDLAALAAVDLG